MAALFSWIATSLGRNAFSRGPFLFAAYYFPTCKKGNRKKECELFRDGQSAGFRFGSTRLTRPDTLVASTSTSKRHELIEWPFHGHYARQEPAGALLMEHSTNARASIVAALCSFLATAYSVSVCSLLRFIFTAVDGLS
jgi:hypothetical protein